MKYLLDDQVINKQLEMASIYFKYYLFILAKLYVHNFENYVYMLITLQQL